jgi:predicted enzyme related to lactoylglutathione lyase
MEKDDREASQSPSSSPTFLELSSHDPLSTRRFLETVFGWSFARSAPSPDGDLVFETGDGGKGRVVPTSGSETPSLGHLYVQDLGSTLERAQRAGGRLIFPRVEMPGKASFFTVELPGGPVLTCWQPAKPARERPR